MGVGGDEARGDDFAGGVDNPVGLAVEAAADVGDGVPFIDNNPIPDNPVLTAVEADNPRGPYERPFGHFGPARPPAGRRYRIRGWNRTMPVDFSILLEVGLLVVLLWLSPRRA